MNNSEISVNRHEQAQSLHQQVMTSGALAAENLFNMAKALKDIRDGKFYKELGYQNFEAYCEEKAGMKRRNAYRYISIAEKIKPKNVPSMAQIGMTKLALLAEISEDKQAEIAESVDLESVSVRELKEEINKLKGEKIKIENERHKLESKLAEESALVLETRSDLEKAKKDLEIAKSNGNKRAVAELEEKIQELKDHSRKLLDEMQKAKEAAKRAKAKEQEAWGKLSIATTDSEFRLVRIEQLERENKELRERPIEVAVEDHSEEYELKLSEAIKAEREKSETERKAIESDFRDEVRKMREDYEQRLKEAIHNANNPSVDVEKEQFKVLLLTAHDALARLLKAAETNGTATYRNKVRNLLASAIERTENIDCQEG